LIEKSRNLQDCCARSYTVHAHEEPGGLQFCTPPAPGSARLAACRLRHVT